MQIWNFTLTPSWIVLGWNCVELLIFLLTCFKCLIMSHLLGFRWQELREVCYQVELGLLGFLDSTIQLGCGWLLDHRQIGRSVIVPFEDMAVRVSVLHDCPILTLVITTWMSIIGLILLSLFVGLVILIELGSLTFFKSIWTLKWSSRDIVVYYFLWISGKTWIQCFLILEGRRNDRRYSIFKKKKILTNQSML